MNLADVKIGQKVRANHRSAMGGNVGTVSKICAEKCSKFPVCVDYPNVPEWWMELKAIDLVEDIAPVVSTTQLLPSEAADRKKIPLASGMLDYFTSALIEVAKVSQAGNDQHNPGQPMHWARGKSTDQADTLIRHFLERGSLDVDGMRHSAKMCWRALAILQLELEAEGAPVARGAKEPETK